MTQVQELVSLEPVNEWSGILVYKADGSITDVDNLVITPKYIKLMDIGTKSYTEYDFGPMAVEVFDEYPEAIKMKLGHIHSHNTMGVFFSTTDMDELTSNSPHHAMYLSLIVNNRLDIECKIGLYCEQEVEVQENYSYSITDVNGKVIPFRGKSNSKKVVKLCIIYDCNVVFPEVSRSPYFNTFCKNYKRIQADKKAKLDAQKASFANQAIYQPNNPMAYGSEKIFGNGVIPALNLDKKPKTLSKAQGQQAYTPLTKYQNERFEKVYKDLIIQVDEESGNEMSEAESIQVLSIIYERLKPHEKTNVVDTFTSKFYEAFVDIGISEAQTMTLISKLCKRLSGYRNHTFINSIVEDLGML